ncbi:MAG: hypothetical protein CM15mP93_17720 [Thiotrichaceae bacterium]|nr:MAG: hypothetical protein CM15mP93_17720 [Thiotrichaceae bacterium]
MNLLKNTALLITLVFSFNVYMLKLKLLCRSCIVKRIPESKAAQKNLNKNLGRNSKKFKTSAERLKKKKENLKKKKMFFQKPKWML